MGNAYQNPFPFPIADPYVLLAPDGLYYLYGSSETNSFCAHVSPDLSRFESIGPVYRTTPTGWCADSLWAPECYFFHGLYYLFFSANWRENPNHEKENFRIGVAVSESPRGPFYDLMNRPLFDPGYPVIDANVFFEAGRYYIFYSRCCYKHKVGDYEESWIYGAALKSDFSGIIGSPTLLLRPAQAWENRSAAQSGRRWNEGSFLIRHGGRYYMTFSANNYAGADYAVGYATADHPLGPYKKAEENPILQSGNGVTGTGHGSILSIKGTKDRYFVYHGRTEKTGDARVGFIDRIAFDDRGKMRILGPTLSPKSITE